jgi:DNA polymerase-1
LKIIALDTETSAKPKHLPWHDGFYLTCVGIVDAVDEFVWWFDHRESSNAPWDLMLQHIQEKIDEADLVVAHNVKFDMNILRSFGIDFTNTKVWCTQVADYLLEGQDRRIFYNLSDVAQRHGFKPKLDEVKRYWDAGKETNIIPRSLLNEYVLDDAHKTLDIYHSQIRKMDTKLVKVVQLQAEFAKVLSEMETRGIKIDVERANDIIKDYTDRKYRVNEYLCKLFNIDDVNLDSGDTLSALLFGGDATFIREEWYYKECKTKPYTYYYPRTVRTKEKVAGMGWVPEKGTAKKKAGYYSTDKTIINNLKCKTKRQKAIKKYLIKYSEIKKVLESLVGKKGNAGLLNKIQPDGLVHTSYNQTVTKTGRLSSSDPNSQNFPRSGTSPIKEVIIPRLDGILNADLSQIEWRMAAFLSQDRTMIREINGGIDQHSSACTSLMELPLTKENRTDAKVFNFRMIYGGTAYGYYMDTKMPPFTLRKWERIVQGFFKKYTGLSQYHVNQVNDTLRTGKHILPTGRWFRFVKDKLVKGVMSYNDRHPKNYPVQGISGGDVLPLAAVIIAKGMRKRNMKSYMFLTVHDSIVFDYVKEELEELAKLCLTVFKNLPYYIEQYFGFSVNVKLEGECEIGVNYGSVKEYDPYD